MRLVAPMSSSSMPAGQSCAPVRAPDECRSAAAPNDFLRTLMQCEVIRAINAEDSPCSLCSPCSGTECLKQLHSGTGGNKWQTSGTLSRKQVAV